MAVGCIFIASFANGRLNLTHPPWFLAHDSKGHFFLAFHESPPASQICKDFFTNSVEVRRSFSWFAFLFGGIFAVMFWNGGRPRRVRCNQCAARCYVPSPISGGYRGVFWLLVVPSAIVLSLALIRAVHGLFFP